MQKHSDKLIFFDLYQTLLDVKLSVNRPNHEIDGWNVFAKSLFKYGKEISGWEFRNLYTKRRDDFYSNKSKEIHHHNLFEITSDVLGKDLGINLSKEEITELIYIYRKASRGHHFRLYPGVFDTLSHLSKEYALSTASYTQGSFTQLELRELNIEQFFSYFVYSSDIGFRKESTEFYKRALEIVGKTAGDCIMIGDNYDVDVLVPQQLGISAIWVKNPITFGRYPMEREPRNSIGLENIEKLPDLIADTIFQENIFNKASSVLKEVFSRYRDKGVVSIYLWGSLLRDDFDPDTSDVDAILLVEDRFSPDEMVEVQKFLKESAPEINEFKANYIYTDELNGGEMRSPLAKVLHSRQLLLNFLDWQYVSGKKFSNADFSLTAFSYTEAVQYIKQDLQKRFLPKIGDSDFDVKHFTKLLLATCYYLHCEMKNKYPFSYNTLLANSIPKTGKMLPILLKIRDNNYALGVSRVYFHEIIEFIETL